MNYETFTEGAEDRTLCLFPQRTFHSPSFIVGNRLALESLRAAIDEALSGEDRHFELNIGSANCHPGDDEVNTIFVIHNTDLDDDRGIVEDLPCPYYSPIAAESYRETAVNLALPESYVMAAGVHFHKKIERLRAEIPNQSDDPE